MADDDLTPAELRAMAADIRFLRDQLEEFGPALRAALRADASGPLSWSLRRQMRKAGEDA